MRSCSLHTVPIAMMLTPAFLLGAIGCSEPAYEPTPSFLVARAAEQVERHRELKAALVRLDPIERGIEAQLASDPRVASVKVALDTGYMYGFNCGTGPDISCLLVVVITSREDMATEQVEQLILSALKTHGVRSASSQLDLSQDSLTWANGWGDAVTLRPDENPDMSAVQQQPRPADPAASSSE